MKEEIVPYENLHLLDIEPAGKFHRRLICASWRAAVLCRRDFLRSWDTCAHRNIEDDRKEPRTK